MTNTYRITHAYRTALAAVSGVTLIIAGMVLVTNVASGSVPATFDSGTATCKTDSLGYCNGPALPFTPNAINVTVQNLYSGPPQAMAVPTAGSFRSRFFLASGTPAAAVNVTYSYLATRGPVTPPPVVTTTTSAPPVVTTTTTSAPPVVTTTTTSLPPTGSTGTVMSNAFVTGYGWPDNDPPGTAISSPSIHTGAGGTGTYADPITIAVGFVGSTKDYATGTRFYIPNVRRYFIVEDSCAACHNTPSGSSTWVDMWVGGNGSDNSGVLACENALTGNHTIIRNPDANRVVVPGALFNGTTKTCTAQFGG
jgi:hypothetical protein